MKDCDTCRRPRVTLEECGICHHPTSIYNLVWMGKPNPFGAWRGEVFSHWKCKDPEACLRRVNMRVSA